MGKGRGKGGMPREVFEEDDFKSGGSPREVSSPFGLGRLRKLSPRGSFSGVLVAPVEDDAPAPEPKRFTVRASKVPRGAAEAGLQGHAAAAASRAARTSKWPKRGLRFYGD